MKKRKITLNSLIILLTLITITFAADTREHIDNDIAAGKPAVLQVSVALADNKNQGIVPVPEAIGNGQDVRTFYESGSQPPPRDL